ncbi:perforin PLP1, putative [Babesia ovata]|uniref:Perforin PLP1, putative n=1 Tax=Babesia ovata TaxID=189622 RepID=A0A2H6KCW0_9APIC|nr:perforin PLP1, putative [Babesia ovata]GBE60831.1 perforin PLP1, putative [Babesia ovata]
MNKCVLRPGHGCTPTMRIVTKGEDQPIVELEKVESESSTSVNASDDDKDTQTSTEGYSSSPAPCACNNGPIPCRRCARMIRPRCSRSYGGYGYGPSYVEMANNDTLAKTGSENEYALNEQSPEEYVEDEDAQQQNGDYEDESEAFNPDEEATQQYEESVGEGANEPQITLVEMGRCMQSYRMGCPYTPRCYSSSFNPGSCGSCSRSYAPRPSCSCQGASSDENDSSESAGSSCPYARRSYNMGYSSCGMPEYRDRYQPSCRSCRRCFSPCSSRCSSRQGGFYSSRYGNSRNNEIKYSLAVRGYTKRRMNSKPQPEGYAYQAENDGSDVDENGNLDMRDLINDDSENRRDTSTTFRTTNGMFNLGVGKSADNVLKNNRDVQIKNAAAKAEVEDTGITENTAEGRSLGFLETARTISNATHYASIAPHYLGQPSGGKMSKRQKAPTFLELGSNFNSKLTNGNVNEKNNRKKEVARESANDDDAVDFDDFMETEQESSDGNGEEQSDDDELVDKDEGEEDGEESDEEDDVKDEREYDEHDNTKRDNVGDVDEDKVKNVDEVKDEDANTNDNEDGDEDEDENKDAVVDEDDDEVKDDNEDEDEDANANEDDDDEDKDDDDEQTEEDDSNATAESSSPIDDDLAEDSDDESDDSTDMKDYKHDTNIESIRAPLGLEYLGAGYDMVKGNPLGDTITLLDPGYRANTIQMHWRKDFEGLSNSLEYIQPKGAWVRSYVSCHKSDTVSEVGQSESMKNALSVDASVSAAVPGDVLKFAASANYNNVKNSENQKGVKTYVSRSYCLNYAAGIPTSIPWDYTTAFNIALKQLPTKFEYERDGVICSPSIYRDNPTSKACSDLGVRQWMRFFTIFGTHVTTKIYLGGKMVTRIETKANQEANLARLGVDVKAEISVQAQVATANGALGVDVSKFKDDKSKTLDSKKSTLALGGDIYGKGKNLSFNDWAETVPNFSMPVKAEYTPIAKFLSTDYVDAYNDAYVFYGKVLVGENVGTT